MPETRAHGLSHAQTVAGVTGRAQTLDVLAERVGSQALFIVFVTAGREDHGAVGTDVDSLAVTLSDDANDFAVAANDFECGRFVHDFNLADFFNSIAVLIKEHIAAALLAANTVLVDCVGTGQRFEAGVTVNHQLGIGLQTDDEVLDPHDFFAEGLDEFIVFFAVGEFKRCTQILIGLIGVLRHHEAAG